MEKGDIVFLDYDAWMVSGEEEEELFDTTNEERAKDNDIYEENATYGPKPFVVGVDGPMKGLGERLLDAEVGKEHEAEIPPDEAYGKRDPKLVEIHSKTEIMRLPEFRDSKEEKEPMPGMEIALEGKRGRITMVTAGRVRLDFNHRLAGKSLRYKYKITDVPKTEEEKVKAILGIYYGNIDNFDVDVEDGVAKVVLADICKYDQIWHTVKRRVVSDLREYVGLDTIQLIEEYTRKDEAVEDEDVEDEDEEGEEDEDVEGEEDEDVEDEDVEDEDVEDEAVEDEDEEGVIPEDEEEGKEEE